MTKKRLQPDDRKQQILNAAIKVASRPGGWATMTRDNVAREAQCADALVSKYFGTMANFRRTIMRVAIASENLSIVAQGIAFGDKNALKADPYLKARALNTLAG